MLSSKKSRKAAPWKIIPGIIATLVALSLAGPATAAPKLSSAPATPSASSSLKSDFDLGSQWRFNSVARMMAGLPPLSPSHFELAETEVWKSHATAMQASWQKLKAGRVSAMASWRDAQVSPTCPVGKTLLYPFSGPDFFNAWWLFPDCETFVMFGLEHLGDSPNLEAMNPKQFARLLTDVRAATSDFIDRNYFITENMAKQLHTAQLRGVVPLVMISMAISGLDILRVVPLKLERAAATTVAAGPVKGGRSLRPQLRGVSIEFRAPGSPVVRRMQYFSADVTDEGLTRYPELLAYFRSLGPTTTFLKSASYLLHNKEFSQIRDTILDVSGFLVQDDSGVPYATLAQRGWQVRLHGRYDVPIPPFERAFQAPLASAYKEQSPQVLPFTFGYQYHDARDQRSNVMVARGPARDERKTLDSSKDVVLRTSGRLGR
jgi:hypothetical protein